MAASAETTAAKSLLQPSRPSSPSLSIIFSSLSDAFFQHQFTLYFSAALLRAFLLLYGLWQDANSPLKYTDIDYLVFTDAARFVVRGDSPYTRDTYRYTPLLAWLLLPTAVRTGSSAAADAALFSSGKILFAVADLLAGWLIERVLTTATTTTASINATPAARSSTSSVGLTMMDGPRARRFAAIWLLNPMVATISTRGSSEGLLGVLVMGLLWAVLARRTVLAGVLLGLGVHLKIYPFIYAPAIVWSMHATQAGPQNARGSGPGTSSGGIMNRVWKILTPSRIKLAAMSLATFLGLNILMYAIYGRAFVTHTYLHHLTRIDHRHNFSPYNLRLYLASANLPARSTSPLLLSLSSLASLPHVEAIAFVPQLLLACVLIPLVMAKKDLATAMLAQTFAFVAFNKVCTSQYFLWYMVLLPLYLPRSSFLRKRTLGIVTIVLWVGAQGLWLQQGYELEFLGRSTFSPGLWLASLAFFLVNCWILGRIIDDAAAY